MSLEIAVINHSKILAFNFKHIKNKIWQCLHIMDPEFQIVICLWFDPSLHSCAKAIKYVLLISKMMWILIQYLRILIYMVYNLFVLLAFIKNFIKNVYYILYFPHSFSLQHSHATVQHTFWESPTFSNSF